MIYVDNLKVVQPRNYRAKYAGAKWGQQWCHLWADDLKELLEFALALGLKETWLQKKSVVPHFDLVPSVRRRAIAAGAKEFDFKEWIKIGRAKIKERSDSIQQPQPKIRPCNRYDIANCTARNNGQCSLEKCTLA